MRNDNGAYETAREIRLICESSKTKDEARERVKAFHPSEDLNDLLDKIKPFIDIKE